MTLEWCHCVKVMILEWSHCVEKSWLWSDVSSFSWPEVNCPMRSQNLKLFWGFDLCDSSSSHCKPVELHQIKDAISGDGTPTNEEPPPESSHSYGASGGTPPPSKSWSGRKAGQYWHKWCNMQIICFFHTQSESTTGKRISLAYFLQQNITLKLLLLQYSNTRLQYQISHNWKNTSNLFPSNSFMEFVENILQHIKD